MKLVSVKEEIRKPLKKTPMIFMQMMYSRVWEPVETVIRDQVLWGCLRTSFGLYQNEIG